MAYVTYLHKRPDTGEVFYVGYGDRLRPNRMNRNNRSAAWMDVYHSVGKPFVEVVGTWETKELAWEHEKKLISHYQELGHPLVNKSAGGHVGGAGRSPSEATRKLISERMKGPLNHNYGKKIDPETIAKIKAATSGSKHHSYGKKLRPETIAKMKAVKLAKKMERLGANL